MRMNADKKRVAQKKEDGDVEKIKDKKIKINKDAAKKFISDGEQTIKRLKKGGAGKEHLDSLNALIELYKDELFNKESDIDWSLDDSMLTFKRKVVTDDVKGIIMEDLFYLKEHYPDEERNLDNMTNWDDIVKIPLSPIVKLEITRTTPDILLEIKPIANYAPYGSDIKIDEDLTVAQKSRYEWDIAVERFKEVNKNVGEKTLNMWIRKQLINGWAISDANVPDIRTIEITVVTYYWQKKPFDVWHVRAYSYNDAYRVTGDHKGFWYWITPIYEKKGSNIQKHGAISEYNRKEFGYLDHAGRESLLEKLYKVSGNKYLYDKAMQSQTVGGTEFIELVKDVQRKYWGNDRYRVTGMLTPMTLEKVDMQVESEASQKTESYKDDDQTLITKLFYVSGDLALYQAAIKEKESNKNPQGPYAQKDAAFRNLVRSTQNVLFGPAFYRSGDMDSDTYKGIDSWGKTYGGNVQVMDNARVNTFVKRDYEKYAYKRTQLEQEIDSEQIKLSQISNNDFGTRNIISVGIMKKQTELDSYKWNGLMGKYAYLRMAINEYNYIQSTYPKEHNVSEYPLANPFIDENTSGNTTYPNPYIYGNLSILQPQNPDVKREVDVFYSGFTGASQESIGKQTAGMDMDMQIKRMALLRDPAMASSSVALLYTNLFELFYPKEGIATSKVRDLKVTTIEVLDDPSKNSLLDNPIYYTENWRLDETSHPRPINMDQNLIDFKYSPNNDEFKRLIDAVGEKADSLKGNPTTAQYLYFSNLYLLYSKYSGNNFRNFYGLKGKGGIYSAKNLLDIAARLVDMEISNVMLKKGSIDAQNLVNERQRFDYLKKSSSEVSSDAVTIPAYLVLDEVEKDPNTYIHSPGYRVPTKQENNLMDDGIPLNVFFKHEDNQYKMWVDLGEGKVKHTEISDVYSRDLALHLLFDQLQGKNVFPNGKIHYVNSEKQIRNIKTSGDHWTWSEILGAISIGLMILAIPFTGGGSAAAIYLVTGAIVTGVLAEGASLYEKYENGTLSGTDVAISGLSILAMVLPGAGLLGKTAKVAQTGSKLAFLEGKTFMTINYVTGGTDALVQGYVLSESFIQQYDNLPANMEEDEKQKAVMELLFLSLAYGTLTYHSFKSDLTDLGNITQPHYTPNFKIDVNTPKISPKVVSVDNNLPTVYRGEQPSLNISYGKNISLGAVLNPNVKVTSSATLPGGTIVKEYSVTQNNVVTKYSKDEFLKKLNAGDFDMNKGSSITNVNANVDDPLIKNGMTNYEERNKDILGKNDKDLVLVENGNETHTNNTNEVNNNKTEEVDVNKNKEEIDIDKKDKVDTQNKFNKLPEEVKKLRLKPSTSYTLNGYNYKTDEYGRIFEVEGNLNIVDKELRLRDKKSSSIAGKGDGRLENDQGGHLIGDQFGGAGGKENLIPMHKDINNYHKGKWGLMEKRWAETINNGGTVEVKIELQYSDLTGRPSAFIITENVNDIFHNFTIINIK